ncbi:MAG: cytochrome c oxidase assembly protein, partial [Segetibacter sp.]
MNSIYSYWQMNWTALISMVLLIILFIKYHNFTLHKSYGFFAIAIALLVLCFFSPLHVLSAHYLFSAHMVVHVILLLIVGPLLVLSLWKEDGKTNPIILKISKVLYKKPVLGWLAGVGIMWFWHLPFVFNYCMSAMHTSQTLSAVLRALESTSLIVAGMLFVWSIISPVKEYRLPALNGV